MEHTWDEAYGYIYGVDGTKIFSYIDQVNADVDFNTLKADIDLAFRTGRAAIVANDLLVMRKSILLKYINTSSESRILSSRRKTKLTTDKGAKAFHALSEAYGFIISLRYTNKPGTDNPYFTKAELMLC
jgi:hypothetical protein